MVEGRGCTLDLVLTELGREGNMECSAIGLECSESGILQLILLCELFSCLGRRSGFFCRLLLASNRGLDRLWLLCDLLDLQWCSGVNLGLSYDWLATNDRRSALGDGLEGVDLCKIVLGLKSITKDENIGD